MTGTGLLTLGSVALASGAAGGWLSRHGRLLVWQERFAGVVMRSLSGFACFRRRGASGIALRRGTA